MNAAGDTDQRPHHLCYIQFGTIYKAIRARETNEYVCFSFAQSKNGLHVEDFNSGKETNDGREKNDGDPRLR